MHHFTLSVGSAESMEKIGAVFALILRKGDLLVLSGPFGAGKTTLTRGVGAGLALRERVTSPTFVVARTHRRSGGKPPLVHVDAYRLNDSSELDDLDIDFENSIVVVEWGKGMVDDVSESWVEVTIERVLVEGHEHDDDDHDDHDDRRIHVKTFGPRWNTRAVAELRDRTRMAAE